MVMRSGFSGASLEGNATVSNQPHRAQIVDLPLFLQG